MPELYKNNASSLLNGGINDSVTSLDVDDATSFPASGNFRILIDSEIMLVTGVSSNTFTVTRGQENTAAASHSDNATVTHIFTAGAIDAIRSDIIQVGAQASRPSASKAGRIYIANDGPYVNHDSGSVWFSYGPVYKLTPVVTANYSWVNQLSATETVRGGIAVLETETGRATPSVAMRVKSAPSTPYTVTMGFIPSMKPTNGQTVNAFCGFVWRESATGKIFNLNLFQADTPDRLVSFRQASATGGFTTVTNWISSLIRPIVWFQITDDGTNLIWRVAHDGVTWRQISTETRTTHFTTAPDQVGYCANQGETIMSVVSWLES